MSRGSECFIVSPYIREQDRQIYLAQMIAPGRNLFNRFRGFGMRGQARLKAVAKPGPYAGGLEEGFSGT
jgi:hypothetical protein